MSDRMVFESFEEPKSATNAAHIFAVNTRFQQLARRPRGVPRKRAIEDAQRRIDELRPAFVSWLDRELQELAATLQQFASNPGKAVALDRAHQACCELRDVGATMGFELVTFVATKFCDTLEAIKAGAAYDESTIDRHMDEFSLARMHPHIKHIEARNGSTKRH
jgi:hypothetical protein